MLSLLTVNVFLLCTSTNGQAAIIYNFRLAKLLMTVRASAIPQERQFSELKRRCGALRNRIKVETLDRDAVVYAWLDDTYYSLFIAFAFAVLMLRR